MYEIFLNLLSMACLLVKLIIVVQVLYHEFNKEEQLAALEAEKAILEERKKLKAEGVIGSTMDAVQVSVWWEVALEQAWASLERD